MKRKVLERGEKNELKAFAEYCFTHFVLAICVLDVHLSQNDN